jgi:hypothetical protein
MLATAEEEGAAADVQAAELTAQLRQARAEAQAAEQAVDDLRQSDVARRQLSVLVRLRRAVRGEWVVLDLVLQLGPMCVRRGG